jgi:hypothetical protein
MLLGHRKEPACSIRAAHPRARGFAFWGGNFWLFTASGGAAKVDTFDTATSTTTTVLPNIGFTVVGAGVSTCAPVVPPS